MKIVIDSENIYLRKKKNFKWKCHIYFFIGNWAERVDEKGVFHNCVEIGSDVTNHKVIFMRHTNVSTPILRHLSISIYSSVVRRMKSCGVGLE